MVECVGLYMYTIYNDHAAIGVAASKRPSMGSSSAQPLLPRLNLDCAVTKLSLV